VRHPVQRSMDRKAVITEVQIRWSVRRDLPEVVDIERHSFEFAWSENDFLNCLRERNCIGLVAEHHDRIVAYIIYELQQNELTVLNLAVHRGYRRLGIGRQLIEKLVRKLSLQRRQRISTHVRESNLDAQLFFKSCGLRAVDVLRNHYEDTTEDAYLFRYEVITDVY